ncbi:MAG TPA: alpha/beta hydrolase-fold protein [Flavitalea sp.]|nr:alpha/beta hydrolase-fold protein [Flavitalea sp.]
MVNRSSRVFHLVFFLSVLFAGVMNAAAADSLTIIDARHYSNVFGEMRHYRVFLPPGYKAEGDKKYPVIYFMHGWSQRYFGSAVNRYAEYEQGDDNAGDNIANFVSRNEVIVVKSDGYNRGMDEEYYLRPYNIGPVETYRQFPIYFPELINHIDAAYRTRANRENRAISGLSMGGFMAFVIGGKYPHLFSAVGNFCGSAEFHIGPRDFPFEYRHLDMYKNYGAQRVRLHYGDRDFIRSYHEDLNRVWPQVMNDYSFRIYPGEHATTGLGDLFGFFVETFKNPPPHPQKWDHIDVYPEFSVWDYLVKTDRSTSGVTALEKVDKRGFRCAVREFLPDGRLLADVSVRVITPPVYEKNQPYIINDTDLRTRKVSQRTILSDDQGRLTITLTGSLHEIGINKRSDKPNLTVAAVAVDNMGWAVHGEEVNISVKLINKGQSPAKNIRARLTAVSPNVSVSKAESAVAGIGINETGSGIPFSFRSGADSAQMVKFKLTIQDGSRNEWTDFFELPIRRALPEIKDIEIADGRVLTVVKGADDMETGVVGRGNGDGIANPGESIVILVKDQNKYWRTELISADSYVDPHGAPVRKSDDWGVFDNVGSSAKYSVPLLSSDIPEGHKIDFFAEYMFPGKMPEHTVKQGKVSITVTGKDQTPPVVGEIRVSGDNIIHARVYDGSAIRSVTATFIFIDRSNRSFTLTLKDDGKDGDDVAGDQVFSKTVPGQPFGFYRVVIAATDAYGNNVLEEVPGKFLLR